MTVKRIVPKSGPVRTAKIKLLKGVCIAGGEDGIAGDIYEVPKHQATELVSHNLAAYTDEGEASEGEDAGAEAHGQGYETATIEPTNRDFKPKKKG